MSENVIAWDATQRLTELTFWSDWDAVASMIASLRIHLFEYGTIPSWNFMFCGGRPELSVPYSWAFTWPSVFAYALPPVWAILVLWFALSVVGFLATRSLLKRWSGSPTGASLGAGLYVLSGIFAARFNAGHVTFAFFHLVPLLMWTFERAFEDGLDRRPRVLPLLMCTLVSFAFMTGGLPHPLLYFYPAFVALCVFRVLIARRSGPPGASRAACFPMLAHGLGIWLAAYKLWPVAVWQLEHPRPGVLAESYSLVQVVGDTLSYRTHYLGATAQESWHAYSAWEHNAYVGTMPWLAAALLLTLQARVLWRRFRPVDAGGRVGVQPTSAGAMVWFALFLVAAGVLLSLGNGHPASPAYWLREFPIVDGIRAFSRFQILTVFGLAACVAHAVAYLEGQFRRGPLRGACIAGIGAAILLPVAAQAVLIGSTILAEPKASILDHYELAPATAVPLHVWNARPAVRQAGHQTSLLQAGFWIASCYTNLDLPGEPIPRKTRTVPLTRPAPDRIESLGAARIVLGYDDASADAAAVRLRLMEGFRVGRRLNAPKSGESTLTIEARVPGQRAGALASAAGLLATLGFFGWMRWRSG